MNRSPSLLLGSLCLASAAALAACASTPPQAAGSAATVAADADRDFYEARCGVCHVAYQKSDFAPAEWPAIVDVMGPRAGLSAAQRVRVLRWLQSR